MKFFITTSLMLLAISASAADLNLKCDVVTLNDDNVFEEGLGETGLYDVDSDSQVVTAVISTTLKSLNIGQHSFDSDDKNMKISLTETDLKIKITAQMAKTQTVILDVNKASMKGVVLQKDASEKRFKVVAEVDCNDNAKLKSLILSNSRKIKSEEVSAKAIPKKVLNKINQIDVPFEMGDGYYDLKSEKYFALSLDEKVVGYALESYMTYTEGDDTVVYTYFLANGVRFSGPNDN